LKTEFNANGSGNWEGINFIFLTEIKNVGKPETDIDV
jgi:hypothetical protein